AQNAAAMVAPALRRASPSNTMKRQGVSLPWSGTRQAMVRSLSISATDGPGAFSSAALVELRVDKSSTASGMGFLLKQDSRPRNWRNEHLRTPPSRADGKVRHDS